MRFHNFVLRRSLQVAALALLTPACSVEGDSPDPNDVASGGTNSLSSGGSSAVEGSDPSSNTGGRTGSGGADGTGGSEPTGTGGTTDPGSGGADGTGGGSPMEGLEECFDGVRTAEGWFQDAIKSSSDGKYQMRLLLETADRFGTSGTFPYLPVRFGMRAPDGVVCITDEAKLETAYTLSRHNCDDALVLVDGNWRYEIENPDSKASGPNTYGNPATLNIYRNDTLVAGPIRMDTTECLATDRSDGLCYSGQPCF